MGIPLTVVLDGCPSTDIVGGHWRFNCYLLCEHHACATCEEHTEAPHLGIGRKGTLAWLKMTTAWTRRLPFNTCTKSRSARPFLFYILHIAYILLYTWYKNNVVFRFVFLFWFWLFFISYRRTWMSCLSYPVRWHGIALSTLLTEWEYRISGVVSWPQKLVSL